MSDLSSVSPAAFTSGYSDIKLQPYSDYSSQYSPTSNGNGMPPAPLPEDNGGNGGEFDLSDEQAEQLLRELDLLGAQLQIMDHETRMLGTKTGNNATRSSLSNNASAQFGRGNAVTPYRMQLTENPSDEQRNWETQSSLDIGSPDEEVGEGANGRSQSAGRSTRKQRALFVPRKPTTAEALMAVDVSSLPVNPSELEPLELAPEPSSSLSPKNWVNSFSRLLNRSNSISGSSHLPDFSAPPGVLERSRTAGARPRPRSLMMFGTGSRRQSSIFSSPVDQQPTRVDIATLTSNESPATSPLSSSPEPAPKPRRNRPYSMSFFSRSNTVEKAASLDMNGAGNKSAEGHDVESDTLLQQINALNQELNANPKSVRLQNDSVQAGTAALFSLARRRIQSRNAFSTNDTNSNHGEIAEEEEDDEIQGVTLNAGGAVNYARRVSTSVYSFA